MKYEATGKKRGRGGYREGSGRKSADGRVGFATLTVLVDEESYNLIVEHGGGSVGVRSICHALLGTPAKMKTISDSVEVAPVRNLYRGKPKV